jgi:hypothetical protein
VKKTDYKEKMYGVRTGFELTGTLRVFKQINNLRMQIAAKSSKKYANPQPAATRISLLKTP